MAGATVRKATLNNYGDVLRKKIKIGARVLVRRSNEVIPEILGTTDFFDNCQDVLKPTTCPYCGSPVVEVGANIFCPNNDCRPRVIAKITNFASKGGMNIDGFSEMTAGILYDNFNVKNFADLYTLEREKLLDLEGFKDAKTDNLLNAIEQSKNVSLSNFIYALGIDNVGKKTAKDLAMNFETLSDLINATKETLVSIPDVGEVVADCIVEYFSNQANLYQINKLEELGLKIFNDTNQKTGVFSGEKVVLTGSLTSFKRDKASKIIEELGGQIMSSVSKNTTLVLAGEEAGSKLDKARKLGIKIIDEETFKSLINT